MPGSVAVAAAATVLPQILCSAFSQVREYQILVNEYAGGESQRSLVTFSSRKRWQITEQLAPTELLALRNFWIARKGNLQAFYLYDPFESTPLGNYDATGASTNGRFIGHFEGDWSETLGPARGQAGIQIAELA
jgi:hypothetical protein